MRDTKEEGNTLIPNQKERMNMFTETNDRKLLREIGYEESLLATMTDEDCEAEVTELPYNA